MSAQRLVTPLPNLSLRLDPQTEKRANVTENYQRVMSIPHVYDGTGLRIVRGSTDGAMYTLPVPLTDMLYVGQAAMVVTPNWLDAGVVVDFIQVSMLANTNTIRYIEFSQDGVNVAGRIIPLNSAGWYDSAAVVTYVLWGLQAYVRARYFRASAGVLVGSDTEFYQRIPR